MVKLAFVVCVFVIGRSIVEAGGHKGSIWLEQIGMRGRGRGHRFTGGDRVYVPRTPSVRARCILCGEAIINTECNVIPMTQWAGESSLRKVTLPNPANLVIIQHTVTPEPTTDEDCERVIKSIRKYQLNTLRFDDIAPSFMVCGNGKVYEGAGWSLAGAHTKGYNQKSIGIYFIGQFSSHLPNSQALAAAKALVACGVKNNHLTNDYKLVGHGQLTSTISPGDNLQQEIETWSHWASIV